MGVGNTQYDRITVYLRGSQTSFFDDLICHLRKEGLSVPSRSDLIRAVIDEATGFSDWKSQSLVEAIATFRKDYSVNK